MTIVETPLPGLRILHPRVFRDERGFFLETYHQQRYAAAGITDVFVQDNHSRSGHGTIRGLHLQLDPPQAKLVRVVVGRVLDIAVDLRAGSPTFGQHHGVELSAENAAQIYIPAGFAHGFAVLSDVAEVEYKCSSHYRPEGEVVIRYDDGELGIVWPFERPTLSPRDRLAPPLRDLRTSLRAEPRPPG